MPSASDGGVIRLRGVRHNNLKGFDLDLPLGRLICVTGLSGSGKSSLAFDTLYAEGQRRYIETFSPYARQFFDRMDKPRVDSIEGIPPSIALEQRNAVRTTRSTVGTMTEICDYMKALWPHLARLHCRQCGREVRKDSPADVWAAVKAECGVRNPESGITQHAPRATEALITFDLPLSAKLSLADSLALVAKQGYSRVLVNGELIRIEDAADHSALRTPHSALTAITVVQDRLKLTPRSRARFTEACEQAYHFGKGRLAVRFVEPHPAIPHSSFRIPHFFSNHLHCASCNLDYREPTPALFSFNHPIGACPACKGFGRIISIDYNLAVPDRSRTLKEGVVKPWLTATGAECQRDLMKFCKKRVVPVNVPFRDLPRETQDWVINGDPGYDPNDPARRWPRLWYGVKGYFRWLESKSYKMHVRVLLSRYRAYTKCPECGGKRFQPEALLYKRAVAAREVFSVQCSVFSPKREIDSTGSLKTDLLNTEHWFTLADFYALPVRGALELIEQLGGSGQSAIGNRQSAIQHALSEVRSRLGYLVEVGLGYLTLDRPTRTLSGGETERVNLTTCLGTRLVNTLFVLDEPSVGLHPRDTERLVRILQRLRDAGNTVVVVEHEAAVMRAADQIVDLGPASGERGGELVFQGSFSEVLNCERSLTGTYLSGQKRIEIPTRRSASGVPVLRLSGATQHNLRDLSVEIPLKRFVVVTGLSGSGKSTLVRDVLFPALQAELRGRAEVKPAAQRMDSESEDDDDDEDEDEKTSGVRLEGSEQLSRVVMVDQSPLGKTPRSNPAVYIGAFDDIREVFAQSDAAQQRGLNASAFSFNSATGQCERCRGAGFEKVEMQFLSDVFIRCPDCDGRRYRVHILKAKMRSAECGVRDANPLSRLSTQTAIEWSIADLLEATVDEAINFLSGFGESRPALRAVASLRLLQEVGLGYLRLGQPINTLSGGESQRLKLVSRLSESEAGNEREAPTLFLFDEPTTGLHFDDVRVLLAVFQRLVDAGHSVLVIEHNLDVIKCADWLIDLGPDAGADGGRIVAQGTPEQIAAVAESRIGMFLRALVQGTISTA